MSVAEATRPVIGRMPVSKYEVDSTVSSLLSSYLRYIEKVEPVSLSTVNNRKWILKAFFRRLNIDDVRDISREDIDECLIRPAKPSTINADKQALRSFFQYCQDYKEIPLLFHWSIIRRKKEVPPDVTIFTREDIARVLTYAKAQQDKLMIVVLFETGMRISELLNMEVKDIRGNQVAIRGKGEKDRLVYMPSELKSAITEHLYRRGISEGCVFRPLQKHKSHPSTKYISAYAVRDRIKAIFKAAGYEMHPHELRHSFAVMWLQSGGDIRTLQLILGHSSIETTMAYLRFTDNHTEAAYKKIFSRSVLT